MEDLKKKKLVIWILSIGGYLLATIIVPLIWTYLLSGRDTSQTDPTFIFVVAGISLIVWIPVVLVAFRMLKKTGYKEAIIFLAAATVGSFLLTRGCWAF